MIVALTTCHLQFVTVKQELMFNYGHASGRRCDLRSQIHPYYPFRNRGNCVWCSIDAILVHRMHTVYMAITVVMR